jgi:hypothetical protein
MAQVPSQVRLFPSSSLVVVRSAVGTEYLDTVTITSQLVIHNQSIGSASSVGVVAYRSESIF